MGIKLQNIGILCNVRCLNKGDAKMNDEVRKAWKKFVKYWHNTEWENVDRKKVEKLIGKYLAFPIPKDIQQEEVGKKFYASVKKTLKIKD